MVVTESPKKTEGEQRAREKWLTWDSVAASFLRGLWFGTHLGNLIPEENHRFEVILGEVQTHSPRRKPAGLEHASGATGAESRPAGQTPTTAHAFRMTLVAQGKLPQINGAFEKIRRARATYGRKIEVELDIKLRSNGM